MTTQQITTPEQFNALPVGTVLTDRDGWKHTKVRNADLDEHGQNVSEHPTTEYVTADGSAHGTFSSVWLWGATVDLPPARPLIDFSGSSRATAREYAEQLVSRVNKPETNEVLGQVASGDKVDAYSLAAALLDASRHVSTRFGQSVTRRAYGEKVAHLGYIAHAVLANHADNLPAYPEGERSRVAAEARSQASDWERVANAHQEHIANLEREARERDDLLGETSQAMAEARQEIETLLSIGAARDETITNLVAEQTYDRKKLSVVTAERDAAAAVISYVVDLIDDPESKARIFGYWDGVKDATLPTSEH